MRAKQNGLALIIVAGLLTLLTAAGMAFARFALQLSDRSSIEFDRAQARLLAQSGLSYATARLFENAASSDPRTADNQPDDWTFRDGATVSLDECRNPSYAHGEPYLDVDKNGCYDQGLDTLLDLDFDGRRDFWSGRLRGRGARDGATFDLKIEPLDGKIDINDGMLSQTDDDQNGIPDFRDVAAPPGNYPITSPWYGIYPGTPLEPRRRNLRVADAINLLEQTTFDYGTAPVAPRAAPVSTVNQVAVDPVNSDTQMLGLRNALPYRAIGTKLIQNRPPGGYVDLDQAYKAACPSNSPQDRDAWARIKPYLSTLHIAERMTWGPWPSWRNPGDPVQAVNVNVAGRPLLQALNAGLRTRYMEAGTGILLTVGMNDAGRVADLLAAQAPIASRYDLFSRLCAAQGQLFPLDTTAGRNHKLNWVAENMEGARDWFMTADVSTPETFPLSGWRTYDLPRPGGSPSPRCTWGAKYNQYARLAPPVPQEVEPGVSYNGNQPLVSASLLPMSLDPFGVGLFSIQSLGRMCGGPGRLSARSSASGTVALRREIAAFSQCHFENEDEIRNTTYMIRGDTAYTSSIPPGVKKNYKSVDFQGFMNDKALKRLKPKAGSGSFSLAYTGYNSYWLAYIRFLLRSMEHRPGEPALQGRPRKSRAQTFPGFPLDSCPDFDQSATHIPLEGVSLVDMENYEGDPGSPYRYHLENCSRETIGKVALMTYTGHRYGEEFFYQPCWEKGQPLRDPPLPWSAASNFLDAVGRASVAQNLSYPPVQAVLRPTLYKPGGRFDYKNADFPWFQDGAFRQGSFDFWSIMDGGCAILSGDLANGPYGGSFSCSASITAGQVGLWVNGESATGARSYAGHSFHRVTATLAKGDSGIASTVYVDGIPDPGLTNTFDDRPPAAAIFIQPGSARGARVFGARLDSARAQTMGLEPAFWNGELEADVPGVPSYTSPLYVFQGTAILNGVSWDGFVPEQIREPSELAGKTPLRVELLIYPDALGKEGTETTVPLPEEQWRTGGGHLDLQKLWRRKHGALLRGRSLRYRVWMDNSAVDGSFSNESPVFDSIRIYYGSQRFLGASE